MTYKASLDRTAIIVTIAVTLLFAVVIFVTYPLLREKVHINPFYLPIVVIIIYAGAYLFRPVGYTVTPEELIVRRMVLSVHIRRSDILRVEQIDRKMIRGSIRTFGVGGLFGYYGYFSNMTLGRMLWYVTSRDKPVLVTTRENRKIIVTPDNPGQFVAEFSG
jgi:hypothetical protein